jgi:hypothetical protein
VNAGNSMLSNQGPNLSNTAYPNPAERIMIKRIMRDCFILEIFFLQEVIETTIRRKTIKSKKPRYGVKQNVQ